MQIPSAYLDLFQEKAVVAHLATIMDDGAPQLTPVWFEYTGDHIRINSAKGRVKDRNMQARPQVALEVMDPTNPYRYVTVQGRVINITEDGADEHIKDLALKYRGTREYNVGTETRRIYTIAIENVYPTE